MNKLDRYTKLGLFVIFFGHILASFTSFGFHHPDEHFQILEWANYFAGNTPDASHLPWEFASQIRPWFQPLLHAFFIKLFMAFGIYEPFSAATFFRLCYAALNIWVLIELWNYFQKKHQLSSKWFLIFSAMWFFPYIHVRTSSENLSGIFTAFALLTFVRIPQVDEKKALSAFFKTGILFGFAFIARYQIALGMAGVAIALLIRDRALLKTHWSMLGGFIIPIALGTLLDRWGYGNWVFTPYLYYKVNIVQNVAASFNPYPWYQYLIWILQFIPFISIPILYGATRFTLKNKTNVFGAFFLSYFILHWFITNKEYRFLFPILNFVPLLAIVWFEDSKKGKVFLKPAALSIYVTVSAVAFVGSSLRGASIKMLGPIHLVHQFTQKHPNAEWLTNLNYLEEGKYKRPFYNIRLTDGFRSEAMHLYTNQEELQQLRSKFSEYFIYFDSNPGPQANAMLSYLDHSGCKSVSSTLTRWASDHFNFDYQVLYYCSNL
jgi:phosphatidylinositol glycan class B